MPVKTQQISDSFIPKDTEIQNEPNITVPANRAELLLATPELLHDRQQVIRCTVQAACLTLDQEGARLSAWQGQSAAVTEYHKESDFVGLKSERKLTRRP